MKFKKVVYTALIAIKRNILRSILTTLGIIIGISSVIVMMQIGKGSSEAISKSIESMGSNNIMIQPGTASSGGISYGAGTVDSVTTEDFESIMQEIPFVKNGTMIVRARTQVIFNNRNWVPQYIYGVTPSFLDVRDWVNLKAGEVFTESDVRSGNKVCMVGETIVRELFEGDEPIGKELRIKNVIFKVVGVLSKKGSNMMGMDQDDIIIAPWTAIKYKVSNTNLNTSSTSTSTETKANSSSPFPVYTPPSGSSVQAAKSTTIDQILLSASNKENIPDIVESITKLLRQQHRLNDDQPEDFTIRDMTEMADMLKNTSLLMTRLLLSVAFISLLVGGIGIMNIMLVSVTERTREIGLRMAVGAKGKDILYQFLIEAIVLCIAGGIGGILLGMIISYAVASFLGWPVSTSVSAIIASVSVSLSVGLIFGFYPAYKASRLDPIQALRYE